MSTEYTSPARPHLDAYYAAKKTGNLTAQKDALWAAFKADPFNATVLHSMGLWCAETRGYGVALQILGEVWKIAPDPTLGYHLGLMLEAVGDDDGALACHEASAELYALADQVTGSSNGAISAPYAAGASCAYRLGHKRLARAMQDKALAATGPDATGMFGRSFIRLLRGDYTQGFADYECRFRLPGASYPASMPPRWDGRAGGRVVVFGEQGIGDVLMFARYLTRIPNPVRVICQPNLVTWVEACGFRAVPNTMQAPPAEWSCPIMSLPHVLGLGSDVPAPLAPFGQDAAPDGVGLCWKGNAQHSNDRDRSAPSLDVFNGLPYTRDISSPVPGDDLLASGRRIAGLRAVVTVDTATAHLAASLGVPTCVIVPSALEWRWGLSGSTTPWYPSVHIVRRRKSDDWPYAVEQAAKWLRGVLASHPSRQAA